MRTYRIIFALLAILCCAPLHGQQPASGATPNSTLALASSLVVDIWPESKMPGRGATEPESLRSPERTDARRITNVSRPTLTLFPAPKTDAPAPAMIVCPGGGYGYVVIDKEGTEIATWLNSNGITALVLKYRVPNNRDGALQDLQRVLSLARARASEWNIAANRLGVIGFSAGGHLAAKASTRFEQRTYPAIDTVDQLSCRPDFAVLVYPAYLEDKNGSVAPDLNLKAKIPPTLLVHTEDDKTFARGSKAYHAALDEAKIPNEFLLYPTGGHGYGLRCTNDARAWPQAASQWLHKLAMASVPVSPLAVPASSANTISNAPLRIAIIGDSTVCEYPSPRPERGWGQFIEERFTPGAVKVFNLAASGRSTKTFIQEGRWKKALDLKPDYVLIQFGHNDSHGPERPESTDAATTYKDYLRRYIDESRTNQAIPILVTPMVRRTFGADGQLKDALQPYAGAMKEVGAEKNVPVLDLHASSKKLVQQLGPEASAAMANKPGDNTHFNEQGARAMADLVMKELATAAPKLKPLLMAPR